jgi:hypothetical protein
VRKFDNFNQVVTSRGTAIESSPRHSPWVGKTNGSSSSRSERIIAEFEMSPEKVRADSRRLLRYWGRGEVGAAGGGAGVGVLNKETRKPRRQKQSLFMVSWIPY